MLCGFVLKRMEREFENMLSFERYFTSMRYKCRFLLAVMLMAVFFMGSGSKVIASENLVKDMYERATDFPQGDLTRLASVLRKADAGKEITLGFIGGSITEGFNATSDENTYVSLVYKWWCDTFPNAEINLINAGIGGTSSYLGVHRVEDDILAHEPDLVFVEFAVNDAFATFGMNSYENLIRRILSAENDPAVILLFSVDQNGESVQAVEAAIGEYYSLPMISYGDAVIPAVDANSITWEEISSDSVHPNDVGHSIYAALICAYIENVYAKLDTIDEASEWTMPEPATAQVYQDAHVENCYTISPTEISGFEEKDVNRYFSGNWIAYEDNASITFTVEAMTIGIIYQRSYDGNFGVYDVYIDGEYAATLDGNYSVGTGTETDTAELYFSEDFEKSEHTVTIEKNPASDKNEFIIAGLLVS